MAIKPVTVSQINSYIKRILQTDPILGNVVVIGEVSNLKLHGSGHVYFSLKDENSKINCFLPASTFSGLNTNIENGNEITVYGYLYLYERGGSYSINVTGVEKSGKGDLAQRFEKLKAKLEKEGIFRRENKKELPFFPEKVAVVTSETGAAVHDILSIIKNRNTCVDILIYPVLVQGPNAAGEIAAALDDINSRYCDVDVIITGRGGGSMEELWAFNEEIVARSIYNSGIPVISAVGHETDFTISDFAADVRAETPTAAATIAVPDTSELKRYIEDINDTMKRSVVNSLSDTKKSLELLNPEISARELKARIMMDQIKADNLAEDLKESLMMKHQLLKGRVHTCRETLEALNPRNILFRGYSVVRDYEGRIIKDISKHSIDEKIVIESAVGQAEGIITKIVEE